MLKKQGMDQQLYLANAKLEFALATGGAGVWELDLATGIIHYDERFREILELGQELTMPVDLFFLYITQITQNDIPMTYNRLRELVSREGVYAREYTYLLPSGKIIYANNRAKYFVNADGKKESIIGILSEDSKRVEALNTAKQISTRILDEINQQIYVSELETDEILFANRTMLKTFGVEEYKGKKCWDVFMGYSKRCEFCPKYKLESETDTYVWENIQPLLQEHTRHIDKIVRWVDGSKVLLHVMFDITDIRQAEEKLVKAKEAAEHANQAKSRFLSHMSHEIRTPMNAIIGMSQITLRRDLPNDIRSNVEHIYEASNHLMSILNDVLDMSKIESGKTSLVLAPFDLLKTLKEVKAIFAQRCEEKRITFVTNISGTRGLTVLGDQLLLKQVLINLLGNAVKFTNENGSVLFIAEAKKTSDKVLLTFTVRDNGIGMSQEQVQKLFRPFEQTDHNISARYGGTGLGLAISQNYVELMKGKICVESKKDEGSKFWFTIELDLAPALEEKESSYQVNIPDFAGKTFLFAEDIEINREILVELLRESDVNIIIAENGRDAVDLYKKEPEKFDLILMDVQMPVLDGLAATKEIRKWERETERLHSIPIIALTANTYSDDVQACQEAGMTDHISKPVDYRELIEKLTNNL